jgi:hypothetical protein
MKIDVSTYAAPNTGLDVTGGIAAAITAASPGDTLWFPNGEYLHTGVVVDKPNLTLSLERLAVVKKKLTPLAGPIVKLMAHGTRIYGGTFEDTPGNTEDHGIHGLFTPVGYSLEMGDVLVKNARAFGIVTGEADLKLDDCIVRDSYHGGIYWNATTSRLGPRITGVKVFKSDLSKYGTHGGIHVRTSGFVAGQPNLNDGTIIRDCYIELPAFANGQGTLHDGNVGIDCWQGMAPSITGNRVVNSRIGYSLSECRLHRVHGNSVHKPGDYGFEYVDCHYGDQVGNTGLGFGVGLSRAVELSGVSTANRFGPDRWIGFAADFHATPGSVGNSML